MGRKGFPESYDLGRLIRFLADLKAGQSPLACPVYSHLTYDIVPGAAVVVDQPDIVILEGLNVLQIASERGGEARVFVSDFFDFSIYVDAAESDIRRWYVERFLLLRGTAFKEPSSYFHRYAALSDEAAERTAETIWDTINGPNLRENILPTRERAHLVLVKGPDHTVDEVWLRKL
jgi:type I pantothenate kinase